VTTLRLGTDLDDTLIPDLAEPKNGQYDAGIIESVARFHPDLVPIP